MDQSSQNTLRSRAAAAISRRRLEEWIRQQESDQKRIEKARWLIEMVLWVKMEVTALPVEIDGLLFDCAPRGGEWRLLLMQPCSDCKELYGTAFDDLADLGALLEDGPQWCERCDC